MEAALDELRAPAARWMAVSGEPGTGKTRLLAELCDRARARGHLVLVGRGAELERELPFGVWVAALDDHVAALGSDRVEGLVGDRLPELARVLPSLAADGDMPVGGLQHERFRAHRAVRALLQQLAARQPVVLVLDDIHWADEASLELVVHLLRRPAPARILTALAFRAGQLPAPVLAALEAARRDSGVRELRLALLSPDEADQLMGDRLAPSVRHDVYRLSGGNPFYLQELARVSRGRAPLPFADEGMAGVPAPVSAALGQEIGGLGELARRLAGGAAVAGDPAELELATAAAGLTEDDALAALEELLARDVLRATAVPRRYAFRHPIVRRAVYEAAGEPWRLGAHARAGAALAGRPSAITARAHHVERSARAGDEAAVAVLEQAAQQATARAPAVAARWLAAALRLLPDRAGADAGRRLGMLAALASAQAATGRLAEALDTLLQTLEWIPPEQAELRARLVAACASCENALGRHGAAHARLLHALADLPDDDDHGAGGAALRVELAADALFDSDFDGMQQWAERAAQTARSLGDPGLLAVAEALVCFAEYNLGRPERADAARRSSAAALDALPDELLMARLDLPYFLGFAEYFCEAYDDAARHFRRGIAVSRAVGQGQFVVSMMVGLAQALERLGSLREALTTAEAAVEAGRLTGNRQAVAFALVAEAWTATELGDVDRARVAADEALAALDELDESVLTRATHAHVGVIWLEIGDPERCIEQLRAAGLPDFPLIEPGRRCWLYAVLARAELEAGDHSAAAEWLARAEATVRGLGLPLAEAWVLHARSLLTLAGGDAAEAARLALAAAERADVVHAPVPAARCRTLAGVALAQAGDVEPAVRLLARAQRDLAAHEANRYRDEAARELRRLGRRVGARQRRAAGDKGSGRSAVASSRSPSAWPRGRRTGRSPTRCSCHRRPSRVISRACSPSSACPREPRWRKSSDVLASDQPPGGAPGHTRRDDHHSRTRVPHASAASHRGHRGRVDILQRRRSPPARLANDLRPRRPRRPRRPHDTLAGRDHRPVPRGRRATAAAPARPHRGALRLADRRRAQRDGARLGLRGRRLLLHPRHLRGRWHRVAAGLPPVIVFVWLAAASTALHLDRFTHDGLPFVAWAALYSIAPLGLPVLYLVQQRGSRRPVAEELLSARRRIVLSRVGGAVLVGALVAFAAPAITIEVWPWALTPLTARIVATVAALFGSVWISVALHRGSTAARIPLQAHAVGLVFLLLAAARGSGDVDWTNPLAPILVAGVAAMLLADIRLAGPSLPRR